MRISVVKIKFTKEVKYLFTSYVKYNILLYISSSWVWIKYVIQRINMQHIMLILFYG